MSPRACRPAWYELWKYAMIDNASRCIGQVIPGCRQRHAERANSVTLSGTGLGRLEGKVTACKSA